MFIFRVEYSRPRHWYWFLIRYWKLPGRPFCVESEMLDGWDYPRMDTKGWVVESYLKKDLSFDLQVICNRTSGFIYANAENRGAWHDSPAWERSRLYLCWWEVLRHNEYVLADKAYRLVNHVIIPYREAMQMALTKRHSAENTSVNAWNPWKHLGYWRPGGRTFDIC